jgi:AP-4 complex subunit mu-1
MAARRFFEKITQVDDRDLLKAAQKSTASGDSDKAGPASSTTASSGGGAAAGAGGSVLDVEDYLPAQATPIFLLDGISYVYLFNFGLYFVATSRMNNSPVLILELLDRYTRLFKDYLGELHEESVRKNTLLLYEILDEALDWGCPQNTDTELLKGYVHSEPIITRRIDLAEKLDQLTLNRKTKSTTATTRPVAMSFAKDRQQKNEFFVDLLERVTAVFSGTGALVKAEIDGCLVMKSYLKGDPVVHLGLTDREMHTAARTPIAFHDINFHHDIGPQDFAQSRMLRFKPPAGEFIALNYRVISDVRLPFRIFPFMEGVPKHPNQIAIIIKIVADFPPHLAATDVTVTMPVPSFTVSISSELGYAATNMGERAELHKNQSLFLWMIPSFGGQTEHVLKSTIFLNHPYVAATFKEIGPIALSFEIPMYTTTGLEIKQLRIMESSESYEVSRWIRYITQSRSYIVRPL